MKKKIRNFLLKLISLLLFVLVSALALFLAYGYRFDLEKRDVEKTSIIDAAAKIDNVNVKLDGELKANVLPYQIKGVLPGIYNLDVSKKGYLPWSREVEVEEDFVTIVYDILLVPEDLNPFIAELHLFDGNEQMKSAKQHMLSYQLGSKELKLISFINNGEIKDEDIEFYRSGISNIEVLDSEKFLVRYEDGGYAYINFYDRQFKSFYLPEGVRSIKVDSIGQSIFFINGESLYRIPFSMLPESELEDLLLYKIQDDVKNFALGLSNEIYFISSGKFYKYGLADEEAKLLDSDFDSYDNVGFTKHGGSGALVTRDINQSRVLYLVNNDKMVRLTDSLDGKPYFNDSGWLLYLNVEGEIYYYDPIDELNEQIATIDPEFEVLGWFTNQGHFIVKDGSSYELMDIFNANKYKLLDDPDVGFLTAFNKTLFYVKDTTLYSLNWQDND